MSPWTVDKLYQSLPAIYRIRDEELGGPLKALLTVMAEQAGLVEKDIARLYDNWFIETCDEWLVPYIGDLLGVPPLIPVKNPDVYSQRAFVANTITYRRQKGTVAILEQLAYDITGWKARAVEFFQLLSTTQHANHVRLHNQASVDLRNGTKLEYLNGPFDTLAHTVDVRNIGSNLLPRGRYNIPNIGIYLWRLCAYPLTWIIPYKVDDLHYTFSVLGNDIQLFNLPITEPEICHLATELSVPAPIRRRGLFENVGDYYGRNIKIEKDGTDIEAEAIIACDLSDWKYEPPSGKVAIDPVLGRLAFASGEAPTSGVKVSYYYGFSGPIGGGEYERSDSFAQIHDERSYCVGSTESYQTITKALEKWASDDKPPAIIEVKDNDTYKETIKIDIPDNCRLTIRAANKKRPFLSLDGEMQISGTASSKFELNGLLIANQPLHTQGNLGQLQLKHCTLVPGRSLKSDGTPNQPSAPSLFVESQNTEIQIKDSILGALRMMTDTDTKVEISDSIIDANDSSAVAYSATDVSREGAPLKIIRCTVIGEVRTGELKLAENCIFLGVVKAIRRQSGCVRFSYLPDRSQVPRRFHCQPIATKIKPQFISLHYGDSGYCQLNPNCPVEIRHGADDESEMGVLSSLQQPQREANLRTQLAEYLPFGLEPGLFYET